MVSILEAAVRYHVPRSIAKLMPSAVSRSLLCNQSASIKGAATLFCLFEPRLPEHVTYHCKGDRLKMH